MVPMRDPRDDHALEVREDPFERLGMFGRLRRERGGQLARRRSRETG